MIKLLKDFDIENLTFAPPRKTGTDAKIIDIAGDLIQTCWCKIVSDHQNLNSSNLNICVNIPDKFKEFLVKLEEKVVALGGEKIINVSSSNEEYFKIPASSNAVFWTNNGNDDEREMVDKNSLKKGNYIRFIIKFKQLYKKKDQTTFSLKMELIQADIHECVQQF